MTIKKILKQHKILILIILLAFLIRLFLFINLQPWDERVMANQIITSDGRGYQNLALNFIQDKTFARFDALRTPGYPVFMAFIYLIFGVHVWLILFFQILLDIGTLIIVYFIAQEIFSQQKVAYLAAFLYAINFLVITLTMIILTESLLIFIFALALLILIQALKHSQLNNQWMPYALVGLMLGLAVLIKPSLQYFSVIILIIIIFACRHKFIPRLAKGLIFMLIFLLTISVWQMRNWQTYGYYSLSAVQGDAMLLYYAGITKSIDENISISQARQELERSLPVEITNPFEKTKWQKKIAMDYILSHLKVYIPLHLKGNLNLFLGTAKSQLVGVLGLKTEEAKRTVVAESFPNRIKRVMKTAQNEYYISPVLFLKQILEYIFLIFGLIFMWLKNKRFYVIFLVLIILYFSQMPGLVGSPRYRIPMIPFYLPVVAYGLYSCWQMIKKKKHAK